MQRREFITLIGGAAQMALPRFARGEGSAKRPLPAGLGRAAQMALPRLARAEVSAKRPLLAVLGGVTRTEFPPSFMEGMREFGYVEGNNIDVAYRFADGHLE